MPITRPEPHPLMAEKMLHRAVGGDEVTRLPLDTLPVRIVEDEVIIYSMALEEIARHRLVPGTQNGVRQLVKSHHPQDDPRERELLLRQRFSELGPVALQFFDGLLHKQTYAK